MTLESHLIARLQEAWEDGCPVAGSSAEARARIAVLARRRWFSFARRHSEGEDSRDSRIEDLARGLCEQCEPGGVRMAGPLISDYRWLAEQLAGILAVESQQSSWSNGDEPS